MADLPVRKITLHLYENGKHIQKNKTFVYQTFKRNMQSCIRRTQLHISYTAVSTSSLQRKEGMQPPEKPFHAKPRLLQEADKSFMHKELPIQKKSLNHQMDFQYSNHVPLHNTENQLKICSGLRQHKQNPAAFRIGAKLHFAMFNFFVKYHLLLISSVTSLNFEENHPCLLQAKITLPINRIRKSTLTRQAPARAQVFPHRAGTPSLRVLWRNLHNTLFAVQKDPASTGHTTDQLTRGIHQENNQPICLPNTRSRWGNKPLRITSKFRSE